MKKRTGCLLLMALLLCAALPARAQGGTPVAGKRAAYIINMPESEIFTQCAKGCVETAQKLGMTCDVFFSDGDDARFREYATQCAEKGYDGLFLSHGGEGYAYDFLTGLKNAYPDLKIVTFDTRFVGADGAEKTIDGVTQFFQDDAGLAERLLQYICDTLAPGVTPVRVLKVWVGDYIAAFDRREIGYARYVADGRIITADTLAPKDFVNATESMYEVMKEYLNTHAAEGIDAVWVAYDAYARGCYRALAEAGADIPLVSVDLCAEDVACMRAEDSVWKACAFTDFRANGEQGIRILALEMAGEYDKIVSPKTGERTNYLEMPASLITRESLSSEDGVAPASYGAVEDLVTSDWLKAAIGY